MVDAGVCITQESDSKLLAIIRAAHALLAAGDAEAVKDNLPSKNFESLIKFYLDMKEKGIEIPAPTVHFSGWHAEGIDIVQEIKYFQIKILMYET